MPDSVWLKDVGGKAFDGQHDECWVPCAKGDPGAVEFEPAGEADEFRDLLHDLVMLDGEESAIGGGPGFKDRKAKAWAAARDKFTP
jgi:hypothetical protein